MMIKITDCYCSIWIYFDHRERPIIIFCFLAKYFQPIELQYCLTILIFRKKHNDVNFHMSTLFLLKINRVSDGVSLLARSFSGWYVIGQIYNVRMISDGYSVFYNTKPSFFTADLSSLNISSGLKLNDRRYFLIRPSDRHADHDRWVICRQIELYLSLLVLIIRWSLTTFLLQYL